MNVIAMRYKERYRDSSSPLWNNWKHDMLKRYTAKKPFINLSRFTPDTIYETLIGLAEPSYQEVATTSFVADYLLGCEYILDRGNPQQHGSLAGVSYDYSKCRPQPHETEIIAYRGKPSVFIRVDLDAVSVGKGKYEHSCGHAVNMTSVLTVAKIAKEKELAVGFIFQPAEEGPGNSIDGYVHPQWFGGGQYLREKGVYSAIPRIVSCHIDTSLKDDEVRITAGLATAAAYRFAITIEGVPAHAALPWQGKNPVLDLSDILRGIAETNRTFGRFKLKGLDHVQYGLISPTQVHTEQCELNSLASYATIRGISRISGSVALELFRRRMAKYDTQLELEAPPVFNDVTLAAIAEEVAQENKYTVQSAPARFRDETAWAGPLSQPWVEEPEKYAPGCEKILHFFTPNYNSASGGLHSTTFQPNHSRAIETQVKMLLGIVRKISREQNRRPFTIDEIVFEMFGNKR